VGRKVWRADAHEPRDVGINQRDGTCLDGAVGFVAKGSGNRESDPARSLFSDSSPTKS